MGGGTERGGNIMRWQFWKGGSVVSREGRMGFKGKIVLYCSGQAKCSRDSLQGFDNSYIIFRNFYITWTSVALWLAHPTRVETVWVRFRGGAVTNLIFNYFDVLMKE